jgi:hypothetical protein
MIINCNGDSFVSGEELGDNSFPNYPGNYPTIPDKKLSEIVQWTNFINTLPFDQILELRNLYRTFALQYNWRPYKSNTPNTALDNFNDLKDLVEYSKFKYSFDINEVALNSNIKNIYCPKGHYIEQIHDLLAEQISNKIAHLENI